MCGITGYVNLDGEQVSPSILEQMTRALEHRGPDGQGIWHHDHIGLGHTRLKIIDLSPLGNQPMISNDRNFILSYNGEIYNFEELKNELKTKGYQFNSTTDTEVLLNGFVEWGINVIHRLNGMFAFVIYDMRQNTLYLARDRYGIKPLYYTQKNKTLIFGSEIKSIIQHPSINVEINLEGLLEYFTFQNFFTDQTLFKDIFLLGPGQYLKIDLNSFKGENSVKNLIVSYWDYDFAEPSSSRSEESYLEELDELFQQAVQRQLMSDVPVGSYLSGGMDSGSITAIASQHLKNMPTFTCGFDTRSASGHEANYDERLAAEHMSCIFGTEHYEMFLKASDMERVLPRVVWSLEEPRVGQSYPNYCIAQLASKFSKVVLSGTGGDELFGGYPWRYVRSLQSDNFEHYVDDYYLYWQRLIPNAEMQKIFHPIWDHVKHVKTRDIFRNVFPVSAEKLTKPEDYINHSLYFEAKTFLHGLLVIEDKLSMSHSLETRVPFLDNDLVDFAMKLPMDLKLKTSSKIIKIHKNKMRTNSLSSYQKRNDL